MNRTWKGIVAFAVALLTVGSVCDDDDSRITGTYELLIIESRDTCDNDLNEVSSVATISRDESGFVIEFGDEATLTGEFSSEGVLVAQGNIVVVREGMEIPAFMQIGIVIKQGVITQGSGRLTYEGTFPGVPGTCVQEFGIAGSRTDSAAPILG